MEFKRGDIDRLGLRLKDGSASDADLHLLDVYRESYGDALEKIVTKIRNELLQEPTARIKVRQSIIAKLRRQATRLSSIQDIAGCRVTVDGILAQNETVERLCDIFSNTKIVDRRARPSHGYRAVHVIVKQDNRLVEIQVRTELQHTWAELSEKLSDLFGPMIKYGEGPMDMRDGLLSFSKMVERHEDQEFRAWEPDETSPPVPPELQSQLEVQRAEVMRSLQKAIALIGRGK